MLGPADTAEMIGGGLGDYAPGEWSDDTQMAVCIAQVSATGADLTSGPALNAIAGRFIDWVYGEPADVGVQTRAVLSAASLSEGSAVLAVRAAARLYARTHPLSAGNGALMRTSIIGVSSLRDRAHTAASARAVAELTHADPLAGDSCVLWSEAIRVAVLEGALDLVGGVDLLPAERRDEWRRRIDAATDADPAQFTPNGFTVTALQAAWAAITWTESTRTSKGGELTIEPALQTAVRIGDDTDTVAAIAGGLLAARSGMASIPPAWVAQVHGWPGLRAPDLVALALLTAQ